ncbi:MAG: nicotinate (nicotinamide) nucleotide adenylyltransferase [Anaerolineae bacterium]|jgi:nicotinate-nucleotide adenylyltransferase|nr:MAG: nicotinate (nicotinamide) nucleotide adenylyltransferase [Anaerolineae bacterium]
MGRVIENTNRIGILGGTFDPLHLGHLILAEEALFQLALSRVFFLLTPCPPHKIDQEITAVEHRLKMLELAIRDQAAFQISRVDLDRPPPHYAVDSLKIIRKNNPKAKLFYLMGEDSLRDLTKWHDPLRFVQQCDGIGVMRRAIDDGTLVELDQALPGIKPKIIFLTAPRFDISSREIRKRVAQGLPFRYFLPPAVYDYIEENGLYRP